MGERVCTWHKPSQAGPAKTQSSAQRRWTPGGCSLEKRQKILSADLTRGAVHRMNQKCMGGCRLLGSLYLYLYLCLCLCLCSYLYLYLYLFLYLYFIVFIFVLVFHLCLCFCFYLCLYLDQTGDITIDIILMTLPSDAPCWFHALSLVGVIGQIGLI